MSRQECRFQKGEPVFEQSEIFYSQVWIISILILDHTKWSWAGQEHFDQNFLIVVGFYQTLTQPWVQKTCQSQFHIEPYQIFLTHSSTFKAFLGLPSIRSIPDVRSTEVLFEVLLQTVDEIVGVLLRYLSRDPTAAWDLLRKLLPKLKAMENYLFWLIYHPSQ